MAEGLLWQLAELDGMPSQPTLRKLIRDHADFPLIERGRRGREYRFDLDVASAFVRANWADARRAKQRAVQAANDRQLSLVGLDLPKSEMIP